LEKAKYRALFENQFLSRPRIKSFPREMKENLAQFF